MQDSLFSDFAPMLRDMTDAAIVEETERPRRLLLDSSQVRGGRIDIAYAPFDHVNLAAKVVVVGLTPGRQQMRNALLQASRSGANAERIAFFLGRKDREDLSSKVEPTRLLAARAQLETKVSALLSSRLTA